MKATEQYFPVVLFLMLCKVVLTIESLDQTPKCDRSKESYLIDKRGTFSSQELSSLLSGN